MSKKIPPQRLAAEAMAADFVLVAWRGNIWMYLDGIFEQVDRPSAVAILLDLLGRSAGLHRNAEEAYKTLLAMVPQIPNALNPPIRNGASCRYLACKDGLLDLDTMTPLPFSDQVFITQRLNFGFDPAATAPMWEQFLDEFSGGDASIVQCLQDFIGWVLVDQRLEKVLVLTGPGKNGKSVFLGVIAKILESMTVHCQLPQVYDERCLHQHAHRKLVICEETQLNPRSEAALKNIASWAPQQVNPKYQQPYDCHPQFRLIMTSNEFSYSTSPQAMQRRLIIVECDNIPAEPDPDLPSKLLSESAGILNWIIAGVQRVAASRCISLPDDHDHVLRKYGDPHAAWARGALELREDSRLYYAEIYDEYVREMERQGYTPSERKRERDLCRLVYTLFPEVERDQWRAGPQKARGFVGIAFSDPDVRRDAYSVARRDEEQKKHSAYLTRVGKALTERERKVRSDRQRLRERAKKAGVAPPNASNGEIDQLLAELVPPRARNYDEDDELLENVIDGLGRTYGNVDDDDADAASGERPGPIADDCGSVPTPPSVGEHVAEANGGGGVPPTHS